MYRAADLILGLLVTPMFTQKAGAVHEISKYDKTLYFVGGKGKLKLSVKSLSLSV